MDLNHVDLTPALISELYGSVLVESNEPGKKAITNNPPLEQKMNEEVQPASPSLIIHLGENKKKILVVVNYPDVVHLPDEELSFLVAMLTACRLTIADVAIFNRNNHKELDQKALLNHFSSRVVFLFGIDPIRFGLPLNFPQFQVQAFSGATYLYTPPLIEFGNNEPLKRQLWECLKRLFVI